MHPICEYVSFLWMSMQINHHLNPVLEPKQKSFQAVNFLRLIFVRPFPLSVQVKAIKVAPRVPNNYPVWIDNWDDFDIEFFEEVLQKCSLFLWLKKLSELLLLFEVVSILKVKKKVVHKPIEYEWAWSFNWMRPGHNENYFFLLLIIYLSVISIFNATYNLLFHGESDALNLVFERSLANNLSLEKYLRLSLL